MSCDGEVAIPDKSQSLTKVSDDESNVTVVKNEDGSETIVVKLSPIVINMREILSNASGTNS